MPVMTDWLDLPAAPNSGDALFSTPPQQSQSVFAPPAQDRRNQIRGSIFTPKNQKKLDTLTRFQAYQSMMRKEQERIQTDEHAARATSELSKLNPRDPMFPDAVAKVVGQYPLAANHDAVRGLLESQSMAFKDERFREERKLRQDQEVMQAIEENPFLAATYDNELRINGDDERAKQKVFQQLFNEKQHAAIVAANPDITKEELEALRDPATKMFNPAEVARVIGQSKQRGEQRRGLAKISALRIKAADPALDEDVRNTINEEIAAYQQAYGKGTAPAAATKIPVINSQAEYDALPKGARYTDSHGKTATKK